MRHLSAHCCTQKQTTMWTPLVALWSVSILLEQPDAASSKTIVCGSGPHVLSNQTTSIDVYQKEGNTIRLNKSKPSVAGWILRFTNKLQQKPVFRSLKISKLEIGTYIVKEMKPLFQGITVGYYPQTHLPLIKAVLNLWERPSLQWSNSQQQTNITIYENRMLTRMCFNVTAGQPRPTVEIVKLPDNRTAETIVLTQTSNHSICLTSQHLNQNDTGTYNVIARNCLHPASAPLSFTIEVLPAEVPSLTILDIQSEQIVIANTYVRGITVSFGDNIIMKFIISGNPKPSLLWTHDNKPLQQSNRVQYNATHFYLMNVSTSDSGNYSFVVRNEIGESSSEIQLLVQEPTESIFIPTLRSEMTGDIATIPLTSCCHGSLSDTSDSGLAWWGVFLIVLFMLVVIGVLTFFAYKHRETVNDFVTNFCSRAGNSKSPTVHWHVTTAYTMGESDNRTRWEEYADDHDDSGDDPDPLAIRSFESFKAIRPKHHPSLPPEFYKPYQQPTATAQTDETDREGEEDEEETKFTGKLPDVVQPSGNAFSEYDANRDCESFQEAEGQTTADKDRTAQATANDLNSSEHKISCAIELPCSEEPQPRGENEEKYEEDYCSDRIIYSSIIHPQPSPTPRDGDTPTPQHGTENIYAAVKKDSKAKKEKFLNYVELDLTALQQKYCK
ncbi:uncharacterized protein LOC134176984 [Corticium candelabrum]|uniref:uncharacterized protein LOC134176984 n=1 Tax=Corticium candelabrum TaxID=121492 RepID=UPI002E2733D5|nr:uncharacterized protein LOC134176984 [Corticium candelabrum]